jgi:hypothetical protein
MPDYSNPWPDDEQRERESREWRASAHEHEDWCLYHDAPEPCYACRPSDPYPNTQCDAVCGWCGRCT